jgi:hypothetical protein
MRTNGVSDFDSLFDDAGVVALLDDVHLDVGACKRSVP